MTVDGQSAMYVRGMYGPEPDAEWITGLFQRAEQARRLRAQRPLLRNGRKPR